MNTHVLQKCEALRRWRILARILLPKTNIDYSFPPGMPQGKDLSLKDLCSLYILLDRSLEHRSPKLSKADKNKLAEQLLMYKRDYFSENFGDGGYLNHMAEFEDDQGQSMEDIIDTKFGTNLSLTWTSTDTKTATDLAKGIRGKYRDETEDAPSAAVGDDEWFSYITFEVRHRIIADRPREATKSKGKGKQSGE